MTINSHDRKAQSDAVRRGLSGLFAARDDGRLAVLCAELGIDLLTLHGSAARDDPQPGDIDVGVLFKTDGQSGRTLIALITALTGITGTDHVDVMDVKRASPTARARALAHDSRVLYESGPGLATRQQMAALTLEMELAPLRRRQLELLATS